MRPRPVYRKRHVHPRKRTLLNHFIYVQFSSRILALGSAGASVGVRVIMDERGQFFFYSIFLTRSSQSRKRIPLSQLFKKFPSLREEKLKIPTKEFFN